MASRCLALVTVLLASALSSGVRAECPHAGTAGETGTLTTNVITRDGGCRWMQVEPAWLAAPRVIVDARLRRDGSSPLPMNAIERGAAMARVDADPDLPLTLVGSGLDRRSLDALCADLFDAGARDVIALEGGLAGIRQQHATAPTPAAASAAEAHAAWLDGAAEIAIESGAGFWRRSSAEGEASQAATLAELVESRDHNRPLVIIANPPSGELRVTAAPRSAAQPVFVVDGGIAAWRMHLERWQHIALAARSPLRAPCGTNGGDP